MTPPGTTLLICLSVCLSVYITNVAGEPPFFIVPSTSYDSESVTESIAPDSVVLTLVAQDANADILTLSIKSQSPESPAFYYDNATDELRVPADGLDAETSQSFTFVFSVTDGNQTVDSVPFTLTVTDVNEFGPVFSPDSYNGTATDGDLPGTVVLTVTATDPDVNATLTYSIAAGNTLDTFSIDGTTGDVKIINAANLDSSTTPSYTLTILASDGSSNTTAQATITVSGASTTDRPTTTQTPCTIYCQNGGSCTLLPSGESSCDCADGFSGDLCEIEDFCVTDPCSDNAVDCKPLTIGRQCICPVGLKGDNCAEDDPVVTCKDSEKQLYLEKFPSDEDRSICLTVDGTTDSDICYNPGERISYQLAVSGEYFNSSVIQDKFCVKYTGNNPAQESICVSVIAFEEDDVILRPWINATSNICFIFNTLPVFAGPSQVKVGFQSSETSKVISLSITDEDDHQSHSAIIKAVSPVTYFTYFAIVNDVDLQVTKPQEITVPVIVQVTITITDNGVPALSSTEVLEVEILPVSSLDCRVEPPPPLLLHMPDEQLPDTEQELGRVSCPNAGNDSGLSFDTRAAVGPVVVRDDGTIVYDPDLRDTQPADGDFNITITARILQPVQLSRDIDVVIIADDFLPNCGQAEAMFNETSLIGDCFDLFVCTERANVDEICDDNSDLFNASCERDSLSGQTNVKLCVADSLVNQVANIQILVTVSNTYGMTEVSVPVTILDVNNPPEIIVPPGQQAYQVPENLEAGYEVATLEVTDPDLQQLQSTEALSVTLTATLKKKKLQSTTIVFEEDLQWARDNTKTLNKKNLKRKQTQVPRVDAKKKKCKGKSRNDAKNASRKSQMSDSHDSHDEGLMENELDKTLKENLESSDMEDASRKSQMSDSHDSHDEGLMENELDKTLKENLESSDMEDASRKSQMSDSHDSHDEGLMENELDKTLKENLESSDMEDASRKSQMSDSHDSHDEGLMENELDKTLKENLESSDMEDASRKSQMSDSHDSHDEGLMENELDKTLKENLESSDMEDASRKSQMSDSHDSHDEGLMENELDKTLKENLESSDMEDASRKSQMSDSHDSHDEGLMENELDKTLKENLESSDMEETDEDLYSSGSEWKDEQAASSDEETGGESVVEESECEDDKSDVYPYLEVNSLDKGRHYSSIGAPSAIKSPEKQTASLPNYRILSEEEKHYCVKNREIFIKQTTKSEKSKHGRCYDIVHSCLYCGKLMSNIQKHLENQHKNENDVKEILKLKKDKEMVINDLNIKKQVGQIISSKQCLIRNKGDHEHNLLVLKSKKGELLLSRRRKGDFVSESYGGCPECLEWLVLRENYNQHRQTCPAKTKSTVTEAVMQNLIFQGKIVSTASKQMQMEVFPIMHNDDITTTAITDPLIVALGEVHFMSSIGNRLKRKNYASYRMRLAARLLHLVRKETDSDSATMTESLNVENFDTFAKCAILACGENADSEMEHPSVAIKIGFDVTKLVAAKIGYAAKERNDVEYKEGKRFQSLLQREWKLKVRKQATVLLDERRFNKQFDLPDPEDVAKLAKYLVEKLDEFSSESICSAEEYRHLAMLTEARLLLYNRRRPGELEALTIETYRKRSRGVSETDLSLRSELTVLEKKLLNSQELLELRGKGNKRVPVILPQEVRRPLKLLVNQTVRQKGAVCPDNKYVFGTSGMEPLRAGAALDVVKYDAGLKYPLRILATNLRKHTATISQVMGLKDNELRWLVNHMGHTEKVHLTHYRATSGLIERLDIAKIMLMQEQGSVSRFAGVELHDINFQDITDLDEEPPAAAPVASVSSDAESAFDEDIEENDLQVEQTNKKKNRTEDVSEATDIPFSASLNDDQSAVSIVTTAPLDYNLINSYQLKLTVTDRAGLSDSVVLTVTVTDVNEAPLCSRTTVEASVSVRNKIGDTVVAIQCSDPDANDVLVYSLQGSEDLFAVDSSSGAVTVRNSLAGLTGTNSLTFYVIVRDKGGLTVNVTVTVTINNSFPPICRGQSYSHSLSENTDANVCFRISINCTDEVTNELLTYAIVSGNGTDNFKLSTEITSNSNVQLCTKVNLKHLYGSYMIGINVSSSYGDTQVQVTVNVQDVNDPPQFALALYRVDVAENTAVGLPVVTVSAIDRDSGAAGIITFSSSDIDNSPYFTLNSNTGTISIKSTVDADVLVNGRIFNYTVEAADSTQQPMSATTTVQITVIDVNDNAPVCTGASATVLLQLTDPVGTLVRTLSCSDGDVSGLYNRIGYRLKDTTQQVFTVNSTGHIVLNQALAREVSTYTVEVEAYDLDKPDDPTFDFLVTITVNIITAIPPICDPSSVVQTLAETEPVGFCLNNEVICRDPTGGTVTVVSESGSGSEFMEIRTNSGTSQLGLNACIKKSLRNNFQQYTLQVEVTNGLATAVVSWTFTVTNINEAPYFLEPKVEKFIDEGFVNPNEAILSLSVDDPDENFDNAAFKIKSVTAVLTDRTNFDDEILFVPLARQFLAIRPLNATVRKLYTYNLTVEDGQGLYDLATVEFRINDINSAPVCPDTRPDVRTDILASVGSQLYKVFCYDTDIDPLNTRLTYRITSGDPDNYLNVTADGRVLVAKKFPRIRLYGTSTVNLTIEVTDQGTPPYVTNVYLGVYVNNQIPSECNPVVTPPDIWVVDKCANLTMDCTDPTIPDSTDHLAYTPEGSYTQGFKLTNPTPGVFRLCYLQTKGGNYEITVKVENGLMAKRYTETIEVQYLAATPVFSSTEYQETVTENFAAGNVIVTVVATSAKLIGSIVYHVIGDSSTAGWASYFSLNQSSGEIKTLKPLGNLADREIRLRIEAEDDGSKLRSSTQVQITVTDINEAPQCTVTPDVDIDVTAAVGTQVVVFNCSDPDVKPEYKSLTYGITGAGVQGVFMLSPVASPVSIVTARKLNVTTPTYILQLSVTDRGTPQLSFSQTFTVTVSLLPPALTVEIVELTYESIKVRWSYADREDFYSVTDSFQVIVSPVQGAVIESQVQGAGIRQLNITGLVAETRYSLVVKANTSYGIRESVPLSFITPVVPILSPIVFTIHVKSKNYTHLYRDPESQLYFQLKQEVLTNMEEKLNGTQGYAGTHLKGFRPANSIYIDLIVFVNQSGNVNDMIEELRQIVQTGWLAVDLALNSSFFYASLGNGYITIEPIVYEPQPIYNGTDAVLTCNILTVGYLVTDTFVYQWTYKGKILQQTSQSRYKMTNDTLAIYENKQSKLQISPMLNDNEGVYGCIVGDRAGAQTASANVTISVLSQPLVTLTPRSETVNQGDQVNLMCAVFVDDDNMFRQFVWYKNGNLLQDGPGLDVSVGDLNQTLTISSIQQTAEYGCQGDGPAGKGPRVLSYIGVIPRDPVGVILCEMTTETRNSYQIRWPRSVAGTTAIEKCPSVYIGEVSRVCDQSGQWQRSVYNCQSKSIVQIQEEVKAVQDGTGTKNLSVSISDLAGETNRTLFEGDLSNALGTLNTVVEIVTDPLAAPVVSTAEAEVDTSNYLRIASNLIENRPPWESRLAQNEEGAIAVPKAVEGYLKGRIQQLSPSGVYFKTFTEENVYAEVGKGERSKYEFPDRSQVGTPAWINNSSTRIEIPAESIKDHASLGYSSSFYKQLPAILDPKFINDGSIDSTTRHINADTVTFQVMGDIGTIDPPARIYFQHYLANYSDPQCVSWDIERNAYVTDGCSMVTTSDTMTECACRHFTNFAILMSPGKTPAADVKALSIISAVGCALSIFFLLLTIILHLIVWRLVKSDRAILLMNLCVALIVAYIIFVAGVGRAENEDVCTAVALLLHFFYLAVFFLMLAYGIEIGVTVIYVFVTRSRIKWMLPLAWGIPLVIVIISAAATKLKGYGNESFCWLSIEDGLLWAFVGPAAFVILFNFIIVIAVIRKMFKSAAMLTKTDKDKAKTGVRSLCVLLPILGLTWVFGIFSVNEDLVVFQYIFAVCNSLQGVFIFIFHCALSKQLRDAYKQRSARKKSLQSFDKSLNKNVHSSDTSTGFYSDSSKPNNDSGFSSETTNPFLQADQQMNKMMDKNKTSVAYDNNKLNVNKDRRDGGGVDLEDVKISNILRESEVMGGTTGISSILQAQSTSLPDTRRVTDDEKGGGLRPSGMSSHKYDYIDSADVSKPASQKYDYVDAPSTSKPSYTENAVYIQAETERPKSYEALPGPYVQKFGVSTDSLGASNDSKKDKNLTDKQKDKIYGSNERGKEGSRKAKDVAVSPRVEKGVASKSQLSKSSKSSRSDEDYEVRIMEPYHRTTHVYMPYGRGIYRSLERLRGDMQPSSSAQNISSISTALPTITYDEYQAKTKKPDSPRKQDSSLKRKDKGGSKTKKPKDRSKAYEYSYESTYLGDRSRHSSLENMNMQHYTPYAQMPGMGGYGTGRPAHQAQHWDQYQQQQQRQQPQQPRQQPRQQPQQPRQQPQQPYYRGDYW